MPANIATCERGSGADVDADDDDDEIRVASTTSLTMTLFAATEICEENIRRHSNEKFLH